MVTNLSTATRSALALVDPGNVARDGATDALLVLGAATAAGLRCSASRAGKGRVLVELREMPSCSLAWIAREMERHLGPGWKVSRARVSQNHLLARRVDEVASPRPCSCATRGLSPWRSSQHGGCTWCGRPIPSAVTP